MKKFTKGCLIFAGTMLAIGFILAFISLLMGGRPSVIYKNGVVAQKLDVMGLKFDRWGIHPSFRWNSDEDNWNTEDLIVNGKIVDQNSISSFDASDIKSLNLSLGAGNIQINERDDDLNTIEIKTQGTGRCTYEVENSTLYIEGFDYGGYTVYPNFYRENEMEIKVPKGMAYDRVKTDIGAGLIEINDISTNYFDSSIGAGKLNLYGASVEEMNIEVGAGDAEVSSGTIVQNADFSISMGKLWFEGSINGNLTAECAMGQIDMDLSGSEADHNYEVKSSAGSVSIGDSWSAGLATEKSVNNGSSSNFNISCDMGSINIDFDN